ncbi:endonuclease/exonuclease/phosphatase family protein [Prosthecobacter sp.]|uniref:endonuclease/exonuclease/phosphatase family protein n=1 Tax=Prosthecobacter sp. TaxID=1965333 RepID=UPI001DB2B653|nr:endonuclease/exonuclease/phosphatase family protein [Prosthecobacter sp.]MCB1276066.1 endonuclease/exonuclease/phosphatase family protein [Prosthecobacter sp.]
MTRLFYLTRRVFGPAVFFITAALLSAAEPERITFCSYNLKNWLTMDRFDRQTYKTLPAAPKPEEERGRVVKILAAIKPDILGVCEIGTADDLADLQKRLKAAGLDLPHTELAHGGDESRRLALLSRLPIKARNSQTELTYQIGAQTLPFQRGILDVTISLSPTFDLHLLGVHLKSMREITEADQAQMRRNEARLLRKHIDSIFTKEPGARILAYGDFNEHRNQPAISEVMGSPRTSDVAMQDVWLKDRNGEVWTHFWDAADSYSRLDYCFASRLLRPHIDYQRSFIYSARDFDKASDHRPLVIKISAEPILKKVDVP